MSGLRIVIADDHAVVRTGYRRLLELESDCRVVAEFGDCEATYTWLSQHEADLLILDLSMPGRGGLETLSRLKQRTPALRILVFSMHESPAIVRQAFQAGADGYLTKSSDPEALVSAVREIQRGKRPLSEQAARALEVASSDQEAPHRTLSPREFQIFTLIASGMSVDEIATRLCISGKTVANYQTSIRQKTGLGSALEMFRYARSNSLIE